MSLEGKLKDFGIADILQLLAQQQKTGILLVEHKQESAEIYFLKGLVIETRSSQHSDRLGEMLIRGEYVTRQQVDTALERQGDTFDYLGTILVRDGLIQHEVLQQALLAQMLDTFFDILQWREGQYRFIADKFKKEGALENIPGIQSILLDVLRMIDEWPEIVKLIPSFDIQFQLMDGHSPDDIEIDELPVYQLIDGKRSVQEIIDGSLLGKYAACKILVELLNDGIIKQSGFKQAARQQEGRTLVSLVFGPGVYILLCALVYAAFLWLPTGRFAGILPGMSCEEGSVSAPLESYTVKIAQQRIRYALEAFNLKNGYYPDALSELADAGLIPEYINSDTVRYEKRGKHYLLGVHLP
jgi:hypothetical protein